MKGRNVFTMISTDNSEFYSKDERLNILHLYITERVRGFDKCGKTCYMSNEQFAKETNSSISTIKRAVKLLTDLRILWAGYHQENIRNKQRVLHIYNERLGTYYESKNTEGQNEPLEQVTEGQFEPLEKDTEVQNDTLRGSICTPERVNLTPSEVQNEPLVYKENISSISIVTRSEPLEDSLSPQSLSETSAPIRYDEWGDEW